MVRFLYWLKGSNCFIVDIYITHIRVYKVLDNGIFSHLTYFFILMVMKALYQELQGGGG